MNQTSGKIAIPNDEALFHGSHVWTMLVNPKHKKRVASQILPKENLDGAPISNEPRDAWKDFTAAKTPSIREGAENDNRHVDSEANDHHVRDSEPIPPPVPRSGPETKVVQPDVSPTRVRRNDLVSQAPVSDSEPSPSPPSPPSKPFLLGFDFDESFDEKHNDEPCSKHESVDSETIAPTNLVPKRVLKPSIPQELRLSSSSPPPNFPQTADELPNLFQESILYPPIRATGQIGRDFRKPDRYPRTYPSKSRRRRHRRKSRRSRYKRQHKRKHHQKTKKADDEYQKLQSLLFDEAAPEDPFPSETGVTGITKLTRLAKLKREVRKLYEKVNGSKLPKDITLDDASESELRTKRSLLEMKLKEDDQIATSTSILELATSFGFSLLHGLLVLLADIELDGAYVTQIIQKLQSDEVGERLLKAKGFTGVLQVWFQVILSCLKKNLPQIMPKMLCLPNEIRRFKETHEAKKYLQHQYFTMKTERDEVLQILAECLTNPSYLQTLQQGMKHREPELAACFADGFQKSNTTTLHVGDTQGLESAHDEPLDISAPPMFPKSYNGPTKSTYNNMRQNTTYMARASSDQLPDSTVTRSASTGQTDNVGTSISSAGSEMNAANVLQLLHYVQAQKQHQGALLQTEEHADVPTTQSEAQKRMIHALRATANTMAPWLNRTLQPSHSKRKSGP